MHGPCSQRERASYRSCRVGEIQVRFTGLTSRLTAVNCRPLRRLRLASAIFCLLVLLAVGCIRSNMSLVVEESLDGAPTAQLEVRTLVSPEFAEILGDPSEWWSAGALGQDSGQAPDQGSQASGQAPDQGIGPPLPPSLEGAAWVASDPDGWVGVAYDVRGPVEDVLAVDTLAQLRNETAAGPGNTLSLEKTANRWNFNWRVEGTNGDVPLNEMEAALSELGIELDTSGFEFNLSVTLPGSLVETNSEDVAETDETTTASWRTTDPAGELFFELITEVPEAPETTETQEDSSGSLNLTWVLLIAFFGVVVITVFFFRVERKVSV